MRRASRHRPTIMPGQRRGVKTRLRFNLVTAMLVLGLMVSGTGAALALTGGFPVGPAGAPLRRSTAARSAGTLPASETWVEASAQAGSRSSGRYVPGRGRSEAVEREPDRSETRAAALRGRRAVSHSRRDCLRSSSAEGTPSLPSSSRSLRRARYTRPSTVVSGSPMSFAISGTVSSAP